MSDPNLQTLIERVQAARASRSPLDIRGGNTKAFYGETPRGEALDMRPLTGISNYEPSELVVTVRAGTPLAELEAALAEKGQCLPFEPPRFGDVGANAGGNGGTVGGMVAAGLAGPARATVGGVRDYVLGATLLNGKAEVLSFGGQVMKNVAGYDVSRLLVGSMGVLGVILEVSLKVLPVAPASTTLRFEMDEAQALRQLNQWGGQPLPLSASAWWNGMLVLRLAGASAAVQAALRKLGGETVEPALAGSFWRGLRDHHDEFFDAAAQAVAAGATLWRLSVPQTAPPLNTPGERLVEWGGAQRWAVTTAPAALMREAAARVGGHALVFRGDKAGGVFAPLPGAQARVHQQMKLAFDPDRVFNPGRLYRDL
ncbi:glycolate oxidase subunit GlcE [Aquabacterium sp.]|uniref:glycolate oxidase subunit GlcE n=1 Tax=Aquabacterium sp. TaxID=1872578 RepID=UPI002B59078F|nr:glycolate oxidase subunit GlcE [Aquabacterium sp.]HSW03343.1 glycolate oxidase subunit GlcE [Aquabacterium sp.]